MKNIIYIIGFSIMSLMLGSCNKFLEMPVSSTTTVDSVFSTTTKANEAIANAYQRCLSQGLVYNYVWNALIQDNITGALHYGFSWSESYSILLNGLTSSSNTEDMNGYAYNWQVIRTAYLVKENIDKVSDMADSMKAIVKAEMQTLIAYRYEQMFIMYGGIPIVSKSLSSTDDLKLPRASLQEVLDSIVNWCDASAKVLPSQWSSDYQGRVTKSAALAIKAKALLYAARPLFNSATPYLSGSASSNLLCLGSHSSSRWDTAAAAAVAVIKEAETNGGLSIINTGSPLDDYGTATSTPGNKEVILAFKYETGYQYLFYNIHYWQAYDNLLTTNYLEYYYKNDGTDQSWPSTTDTLAFSDYLTKMNEMEPRFKASFRAWETDAWNNAGNSYWKNANIWEWATDGCAQMTKFYYGAGTRLWFDFPIFRLAAFYLSAAEAYNELGDNTNALKYLNVIHQRAGLPAITETDQTKLRKIIHREWNVEFFGENYYYHDAKHWKDYDNGDGILGGQVRMFSFNNGTGAKSTGNTNYFDKVKFTAFWAPREYLDPFPVDETNKGIIVQNPGY